jgi:DNA repair exonuclease SbcCD ATPase subunit
MDLEERIEQLEKQKKLLQDSIRKFQTNRPLDTMDEVAYREIQLENKNLKAKINELEGRLGSAQDINDNHQRYNSGLQTRLTEVEEDNKKLSHQIEDKVSQLRKSGM